MSPPNLIPQQSFRQTIGAFGKVVRLYWSVFTGLLLFLWILVLAYLFLNQDEPRILVVSLKEDNTDFWAHRKLPLPLKQGHIFPLTPQHPQINKRSLQYNLTPSVPLINQDSDISTSLNSDPWVVAITPTYKRVTQKLDLTGLCQTLASVSNLIWIVVEDSQEKTELVKKLLQRCQVWTVHLNVPTSGMWFRAKGVEQRNHGLSWLRKFCSDVKTCLGGVYFMDDDNRYDLRLFEEIRHTRYLGVWPVAFIGGAPFEGPLCSEDGHVTRWVSFLQQRRNIPIDMAGFAINVRLLLDKPSVVIGRDLSGGILNSPGVLETFFIENFITNLTDPRLECKGSTSEIFVWHVKTKEPVTSKYLRDYGYEI